MRARGCLAGVLAIAAAPGAAPAASRTIAPFVAHFTADWKSINVGTSDIELAADTVPGRYLYTWTLMGRGVFRLAFDDVIQKSWISVQAGEVRPEKYLAQQGGATLSIDFDWSDGHARGQAEGKAIDLTLSAGTQDVMSIQIQVMLDVGNDTLPGTFKILDKDAIKDFIRAAQTEVKVTALRTKDQRDQVIQDTVLSYAELERWQQRLDRLHEIFPEYQKMEAAVASRRAGSNRVLKMWFAPSLGFVPVQAERFRDGKLEFAMRIRSLKN